MFSKTKKRAVGVVAASMVAVMASAGVAQAAPPQCQASSVKIAGKGLLSSLQLNPFQLGGGVRCADASRREVGVNAGVAQVHAVVNDTSVNGRAHSQIAQAFVNIPGLSVQAYALETSASASCYPSGFTTTSRVAQLYVNGRAIVIPRNNASTVTVLPFGIYVYLNRAATTATGTTVSAVSIITPLADVTLAESRLTGGPCAFYPEITLPPVTITSDVATPLS